MERREGSAGSASTEVSFLLLGVDGADCERSVGLDDGTTVFREQDRLEVRERGICGVYCRERDDGPAGVC
jgi:hypothetical protein